MSWRSSEARSAQSARDKEHEVADVKHAIKAHAQGLLEGEDVVVEPIHGSMDVAGGADEHDFLVALPMNARRDVKPKILPDDVYVTRRR
jgi:hypothetical protein